MKKYKDLFVPFKLALQLKELGFNEPCMARWDKINPTDPSIKKSNRVFQLFVSTGSQETVSWQICSAPLYSQAIGWILDNSKYGWLNITHFSDHSGAWILAAWSTESNEEIQFDNLKEAIEKGLTLLKE